MSAFDPLDPSQGRLVDLSHPLRDGDEAYPGDPGVSYEVAHEIGEQGYHVTLIKMGSHVGTHLDAPRHIDDRGATVDLLDLAKLVGPAYVVDVALSEDEGITESDLDIEVEELPRGARLLFRTGWASKRGSREFFTDFPDLDLGLAQGLAARKVALIGLEQPSVHKIEHLEVHRVLLEAGVVVVEALANLDALRTKEVFLACLPLPHVGLDGAAVRAVAWESS